MVIVGKFSLGHMGYSYGSSVESWQFGPNSVGGVGVKFSFKNDTEKTVKYASFTFLPFNAVQDVVSCNTKGNTRFTIRYTGPLNPGAVHRGCYCENCWYNNTITAVALVEIQVEYMDGSSETLTGTDIRFEEAQGCYVATAVYGSYDCPQVWTLRRFRDDTLAESWYGRAFIRTYYAVSPTLVRWFGETQWFQHFWRGKLDKLVARLQNQGVESSPYDDKDW